MEPSIYILQVSYLLCGITVPGMFEKLTVLEPVNVKFGVMVPPMLLLPVETIFLYSPQRHSAT